MNTKKLSLEDAGELSATFYMQGKKPMQDAHFVLLTDNTVHVLIHEGGYRARDSIISQKKAIKLRDSLHKLNWVVVTRPRRTFEQIRAEIDAACRKFLAKRTYFDPDPDANLVPPASQIQRQRENLYLPSVASTRGARVLPGGAFESKKSRH